MLPSSEDKKMLIQSMKKLTHHISNNKIRQQQIFKSLSKNDILKIIFNLTDQNEYLRRISALLLAQLFYSNQPVKKKFLQTLEINPHQGRICLNQIPEPIQKYPSTLKKCIQLMKSPLRSEQADSFCWVINLDRKILQLECLDYKKYSSFTFLDPNRNIFGFVYGATNISEKSSTVLLKNQKKYEPRSSQKSVKSINSNQSNKRQLGGLGNSFYKNYIDSRNRKVQSPSSYKQHYQKRQYIRPSTSRNNNTTTRLNGMSHNSSMTNSKNKNLNNSGIMPTKNVNFNLNVKDSPQQSISSSFVSSRNRQAANNNNLKLNSLHESIDLGRSSLGNNHNISVNTYKQSFSGYRAPMTDRKPQMSTPDRSPKINQSLRFNTSMGDNAQYPQSTKSSYTNQHQKFYKRVKEILKR